MSDLNAENFLNFLSESLMYDEEPLQMDVPLPELVFDSIGKLMVAAAFEKRHGIQLSLDQLITCKTPRDIYELVQPKN